MGKRFYGGVGTVFLMYWRTYGGVRSVVRSPFFHSALVFTLLCFPLWSIRDWWNTTIAIVPAILGFSIAAFALLLAVGDDGFKRRLGASRSGGRASILNGTSAGILHFILVQISAVFLAIFASSRPITFVLSHVDSSKFPDWLWAFVQAASLCFRALGFFLLCYSLTTAVAATLSIFRLATVFSTYATHMTKAARESQPGGGTSNSPPNAGVD